MDLSIIICTQNRGASLAKTLRAFDRVYIPPGWSPELIVVDNASTDDTASVVKGVRSKFTIHYLYEPKKGQSNARNAGLAAATGEVILFTDDDVIPSENWLEQMTTCLHSRECDGVVGSIRLSEHLLRGWMQQVHKVWLAAPDGLPTGSPELIGANMGFHRTVLDRVPAFDPELGPGALGFADDTLFSKQLCAAGFRLRFVPDASVVHHPEPSRLLRREWLTGARKRGQTLAYLLHHWHHGNIPHPQFRLRFLSIKLRIRRSLNRLSPMDAEGCPAWEMSYVTEAERCRHFQVERKRPRNYDKHGLRRKSLGSISQS